MEENNVGISLKTLFRNNHDQHILAKNGQQVVAFISDGEMPLSELRELLRLTAEISGNLCVYGQRIPRSATER